MRRLPGLLSAAVLAPGEWATVLVIASDRPQSRVVLQYIKALLESVPMLARLVISEKAESIELQNRVRIEVATCPFRAPRGYTIAACVCDEIAFWRSDESAHPDNEVLDAIRPGMATVPGSLLLAISSPYSRRGSLWQAYQKHHGKESPVLVWQAPSRVMNPLLAAEVVDEALAADSASARAEYLAEFRSDVEGFVYLEALQACIAQDCRERPPVTGVSYRAFVDPSGGSCDSMTMAISHAERERAILDCIREVVPPFSPESVVVEFSATLRGYRISEAYGDRYAASWVTESFGRQGIRLRASELNRSELYLDVLPAINSGQVELLDLPRMVYQFQMLERRTGRGSGKDVVDHAPGAHDDLANAVAGALTLALKELGGAHGYGLIDLYKRLASASRSGAQASGAELEAALVGLAAPYAFRHVQAPITLQPAKLGSCPTCGSASVIPISGNAAHCNSCGNQWQLAPRRPVAYGGFDANGRARVIWR